MTTASSAAPAVRLYADERGAGPPVVILHGLFGSSANWRSFAAALAATHRVCCLDLRNHGRSPHTDEHDYDAMAADVRAFLELRGFAGVTLVGHSMGGKAAMQFALKFPDRLAGLVVMDIGPGAHDADRSVIDALTDVDVGTATTREDVDLRLSRFLADRALRAFLLMSLDRRQHGFGWRFNLAAISANYEAIVGPVDEGRFSGRILFLRGERSAYLRHSDAEIESRFPAARIRTIPQAGHWVHVDAPAATLDEVRQFADRAAELRPA